MGPRGRRTMARIDRLNYRDIGVIKAPLCQDPFLEGVDETRDWTPGVMVLSLSLFLVSSFVDLLFLSLHPGLQPLCHFLARLGNALLISHYPRGDAAPTNHREFHASGRFQSRRRKKEKPAA